MLYKTRYTVHQTSGLCVCGNCGPGGGGRSAKLFVSDCGAINPLFYIAAQLYIWNRYLQLCEVCSVRFIGAAARRPSILPGEYAGATLGQSVRGTYRGSPTRTRAGPPGPLSATGRGAKEKAPVIADTGLCSGTLFGASCRSEGVRRFGLLPPSSEGAAQGHLDALAFVYWCPGPESNRHALRRGILSPLRLPISPPGLEPGRNR